MGESHNLALKFYDNSTERGRYAEFQDSYFTPATNKLGCEENAYPKVLVVARDEPQIRL